MVRRRSTVRFREGAPGAQWLPWRRSSGAEQAAHNRRVGGSSPPAATKGLPVARVGARSRRNNGVTKELLCWCPRCGANVIDVDGYWMLGHRLSGDCMEPPDATGEARIPPFPCVLA
jgi:hypothetical protein